MAELVAKINLDASAFMRGLNELSTAAQNTAKTIQNGFTDALGRKLDVSETAKSVGELTEKTKTFGERMAVFSLASQGIQQMAGALGSVVDAGIQFDNSLKAVGAITGATGEALDDLGRRARELAVTFGGTASDQLKSFQGILSKFGAQVAESPAALAKMAESVNLLAKAGGIDAAQAMDALTDTMLQMGLVTGDATKDAENAVRVIDALASSAQIGAAEIPQVAASMLQVGVAAKGANLSVEQTVGALQVLAVGGKKGAEAGTALRNVLGLIQKASGPAEAAMKSLGTSSEELGRLLTTPGKGLQSAIEKIREGMNKLGSDAERNRALMEIFGTENAAAAGILLQNAEKLREFTTGIESAVKEGAAGAAGAVQQAQINMQSAGEMISRIKARVEDAFIGMTQAVGSGVTAAIGAVNQIAPTLTGIAGIKTIFPESAVSSFVQQARTVGERVALSLKDGATKNAPQLVEKLSATLSTLKINTQSLQNSLSSAFAASAAKLAPMLTQTFSAAANSIGQLANVAFGPWGLALGAVSGALALFFTQTEAGKTALEEIQKTFSAAFQTLADSFKPVIESFSAAFTSLSSSGSGLITALQPLLSFLGGAVSAGLTNLASVLTTVAAGIATFITGVAGGVRFLIEQFTAFTTAIAPVTTQVGQLFSDISAFFVSMAKGFGTNILAVFQVLGDVVSFIGTQVVALGNALKTGLVAAFTQIQKIAAPIIGLFGSIGKSVVALFPIFSGVGSSTAQAATGLTSVGNAANQSKAQLSGFASVVEVVRSATINVRAALAGVSGVLEVVGNSFSQFLEGVRTLDVSKITGAFSNIGDRVKSAFTGKWNETWNEAQQQTVRAADGIGNTLKTTIPAAGADAGRQTGEALSTSIADGLKEISLKSLSEAFKTELELLKNTAQEALGGLNQLATNSIPEQQQKVKALMEQISKATVAQEKTRLEEQLRQEKIYLEQLQQTQKTAQQVALDSSKEAAKRERLARENEQKFDFSRRLETAKRLKEQELELLAERLKSERSLLNNKQALERQELEDKFAIQRKKVELDKKFGLLTQAEAAQLNTKLKQLDEQLANERRVLRAKQLLETVEEERKAAEARLKASIEANQRELELLTAQDEQTITARFERQRVIQRQQQQLALQELIQSQPVFQKALQQIQATVDDKGSAKSLEQIREEIDALTAAFERFAEGGGVEAFAALSPALQSVIDANIESLTTFGTRASTELKRQKTETERLTAEMTKAITIARIKGNRDGFEREAQLQIAEAQARYEQELKIVGDNEAQKTRLYLQFEAERQQALANLQQAQAASSLESGVIKRLSELQAAYAKDVNNYAQALETKRAAIEKFQTELAAIERGGGDVSRVERLRQSLEKERQTLQQYAARKLEIDTQYAVERNRVLEEAFRSSGRLFDGQITALSQLAATALRLIEQVSGRVVGAANEYERASLNLLKARERELRAENLTAARRTELLKKYAEDERKLRAQFGGDTFFGNLKNAASEAFGALSQQSMAAFSQATARAKSFADVTGEAWGTAVTGVVSKFGELAAAGVAPWKAIAQAALDGLMALVPVLTAQIFGLYAASPNPVNILGLGVPGTVAAAAITAILMGLVAAAKAAIGYEMGGLVRGGHHDGRGKLIRINERGEEFVVNHRSTRKNLHALEVINKQNISVEEYVLEKATRSEWLQRKIFERVALPSLLAKHGIAYTGDVSLRHLQPRPLYNERIVVRALQLSAHGVGGESDARGEISLQTLRQMRETNGLLERELGLLRTELQAVRTEVARLNREFRHNTNVELQVAAKPEFFDVQRKRREREVLR